MAVSRTCACQLVTAATREAIESTQANAATWTWWASRQSLHLGDEPLMFGVPEALPGGHGRPHRRQAVTGGLPPKADAQPAGSGGGATRTRDPFRASSSTEAAAPARLRRIPTLPTRTWARVSSRQRTA